jgi:hypothetical protein
MRMPIPVSSHTARIADLCAPCELGSSTARSSRGATPPRTCALRRDRHTTPDPARCSGTGLLCPAHPWKKAPVTRLADRPSPAPQSRSGWWRPRPAPARRAPGARLCGISHLRPLAGTRFAILLGTRPTDSFSHHDRDPASFPHLSAIPSAPPTSDRPPVPKPSIRSANRTSSQMVPAPAHRLRTARINAPLRSSERPMG